MAALQPNGDENEVVTPFEAPCVMVDLMMLPGLPEVCLRCPVCDGESNDAARPFLSLSRMPRV
jgi:hypothetical protein